MGFYIGQRVIISNRFIGVVDIKQWDEPTSGSTWIRLPGDVVCQYDENNVKPLPNGQL